jgi:hypothetical protein
MHINLNIIRIFLCHLQLQISKTWWILPDVPFFYCWLRWDIRIQKTFKIKQSSDILRGLKSGIISLINWGHEAPNVVASNVSSHFSTGTNIHAFEGDPESVTIFGESGGGWSTSFQSLVPSNRGLFQRVISQSGVVSTNLYMSSVGHKVFFSRSFIKSWIVFLGNRLVLPTTPLCDITRWKRPLLFL